MDRAFDRSALSKPSTSCTRAELITHGRVPSVPNSKSLRSPQSNLPNLLKHLSPPKGDKLKAAAIRENLASKACMSCMKNLPLTSALHEFGLGLLSPLTALFASPKAFAYGTASIATIFAISTLTDGIASPALFVFGSAYGAWGILKGMKTFLRHPQKEEMLHGCRELGAGVSSIALSILGSRSALGAFSKESQTMPFTKTLIENFKFFPDSIVQTFARALRYTGINTTNVPYSLVADRIIVHSPEAPRTFELLPSTGADILSNLGNNYTSVKPERQN